MRSRIRKLRNSSRSGCSRWQQDDDRLGMKKVSVIAQAPCDMSILTYHEIEVRRSQSAGCSGERLNLVCSRSQLGENR